MNIYIVITYNEMFSIHSKQRIKLCANKSGAILDQFHVIHNWKKLNV